MTIVRFQHEPMPRFTQIVCDFGNPQCIAESVLWESEVCVSKNYPILLANSKPLSFSTVIFGPAQKRLD